MSKSTIRQLTPEELALISGGAQVDTNDLPPVEVRPPDDWDPNPGPPDIIDPILDPGPGDNGGGGGGGDQPTYEQVDAEADNLARSIESLIKSDPNYQSYEIGAVIYKDANTGELKSSPLAQGSPSDPPIH